jgi:hypothetical protein
MRVPQVSERIKEAPAQALRGVFAGIGQLLLITDKLRNKATASQQVPQARTPEPSETAPPAAPAPAADASAATAAAATAASAGTAPAPGAEAPGAEAPGAEAPGAPAERDFDKTGNVRLLTRAEAAAGDTAPVTDATVAAEPVAAVAEAPVAADPVAAGVPLPNYDELSIASLRARLRNLDVAQLRQLVEYESAHANRTDVITMFERRVAKLQADTTPEERGEAGAEAEIEAREEVEAEVQQEVGAEAEGEE